MDDFTPTKVTRIPPVNPEIVRNRDLTYKMMGKGVGRHEKSWHSPRLSNGTAEFGAEFAENLARMRSICNANGYRLKWTVDNGTIPTGSVIHHVDGDRKNDKIENLACLTRSQHGTLHWRIRNGQAEYGDWGAIEQVCSEL